MDCEFLLLEQQLQPKAPSQAQVWDQGSATHCPLCSRAAPAASELEGAFSNTDNNCCQDESLTGIYCTPIFEAPSVISFTTDDMVQMLV